MNSGKIRISEQNNYGTMIFNAWVTLDGIEYMAAGSCKSRQEATEKAFKFIKDANEDKYDLNPASYSSG